MTNRRKEADDRAVNKTVPIDAPSKKPPVVNMGDIVIYAHRPMTSDVNAPAVIRMPMIVTSVHEDERTINGVVLNDNMYVGFTGAKMIEKALMGDGPGEWQLRT